MAKRVMPKTLDVYVARHSLRCVIVEQNAATRQDVWSRFPELNKVEPFQADSAIVYLKSHTITLGDRVKV